MEQGRLKKFLNEIFGKKEGVESGGKKEPESKGRPAVEADAEQKKEKEARTEAEAKAKAEAEAKAAVKEDVQQAPVETPPRHRHALGDGYYLGYDEVPNGYGGYCEADMRLYREDRLIRRITDRSGNFLDFPGVVRGGWQNRLSIRFTPTVNFRVWISGFQEDGLASFHWTVQPDGRYWADDDGFGMEDDEEVNLVSKFNKEGIFVTPFAPEP